MPTKARTELEVRYVPDRNSTSNAIGHVYIRTKGAGMDVPVCHYESPTEALVRESKESLARAQRNLATSTFLNRATAKFLEQTK